MSNIKIRDKNGESLNKRHSPVATTKTKKSSRYIKLNETALEYLYKVKEYKEVHKIDTDYILYADNGNKVSARNLQRTLDLVLKKADVPHCGLHILRHTFGSTLIRHGVDVSVVSKLMGHSSITITYNKYIHILEEQETRAVELLNVI